MSGQSSKVVVCQIGARENYAIARSLKRRGLLAGLVTDEWAPPNSVLTAILPSRLQERCHEELADQRVIASTLVSGFRRGRDKILVCSSWAQIMAKNAWFQSVAARRLEAFSDTGYSVFSYSYAAGEIFAKAKQRGWQTVLGQIDPGPIEARLVTDLYEQAGQGHVHEHIPPQYWDLWHREVDLADTIVVNSAWSREALVAEGVPEQKITIIPLAFEGEAKAPREVLPSAFSSERPLRLLFLGQVTLRKGIGVLFDTLRLLEDLPLSLDIVGPIQVEIPRAVSNDQRVTFHGPVARSKTKPFYEHADLFLFPTLSDGFGLTQLEALAAGVPVVASRFCGDVVREGVNGHILPSLDPHDLASIIRALADEPARLSCLQEGAYVEERFGLDAIGRKLEDLMQ
jgi:glycosyltransferase involved in cell wall biosynthesis